MILIVRKDAIEALIAQAENEPVRFSVMQRLAGKTRTPELAKMNDDKTLNFGGGYFVTFTHEEHGTKANVVLCRHLSVSGPGRFPTRAAVRAIMVEFGFKNAMEGCALYLEDIGEGRQAVNLIEPIDGNMTRLATPYTREHRSRPRVRS